MLWYHRMGFMSTTSDKAVAIHYSRVKENQCHAVLFEIRVSAVDRGACIQAFSQYPDEEEHLWVPCSFLEPFGPKHLEITSDGVLEVIPVRVNANLTARTVEDIVNEKKRLHLDSFKFLMEEVRHDLAYLAKERNAVNRCRSDPSAIREPFNKVENIVSRILQQCQMVFDRHQALDPNEYVMAERFRGLVIEMLEVKTMSVSKFEFWLSDNTQLISFLFNEHLRTAHRGRIAFLQRKLPAAADAQAAALTLCQIMGLVLKSVEEENDLGEVRIISAAAEGLSAKNLKLLVQAGARVNSTDGNGDTAVIKASAAGHADTVMDLAALRADVNHTNSEGDTAVVLASQEGHADCIHVLASLKADVNVTTPAGITSLRMAAQNGHTDCVRALCALRANIHARNAQGATALHHAAHHGHLECIQALVELKADIDATTLKGFTPASLAEVYRRIECLRCLQRLGAHIDASSQALLSEVDASEAAARSATADS